MAAIYGQEAHRQYQARTPVLPFPKNRLTKQFEPFIRKEVEKYCQSYQHVPRLDMLGEAVRLSVAAEARFKPALGISFATFVAYRLRELQRFAERYDGSQRFRAMRTPRSGQPGWLKNAVKIPSPSPLKVVAMARALDLIGNL